MPIRVGFLQIALVAGQNFGRGGRDIDDCTQSEVGNLGLEASNSKKTNEDMPLCIQELYRRKRCGICSMFVPKAHTPNRENIYPKRAEELACDGPSSLTTAQKMNALEKALAHSTSNLTAIRLKQAVNTLNSYACLVEVFEGPILQKSTGSCVDYSSEIIAYPKPA